MLPWWSTSDFNIMFCLVLFVLAFFCSGALIIIFPHHSRPNLSLVVLLALSTLDKLPKSFKLRLCHPSSCRDGSRARIQTSLHLAYFKRKGQGSAMLVEKPIPESKREDNTQGAAHKRVDETQVVKDTRGGYTARKAEVSACCIPAQAPVESRLRRR